MSRVQNVVIESVRTVIGWVPERWLPGGTPDPLIARRGEVGRQVPRLDTLPLVGVTNMSAAGSSALPIMQDAEIRYNGQVVALVLADTQQQADHAASLIRIDYAGGTASTRFEDAKATARTPASMLVEKNHLVVGNPDRELAKAAYRVDHVYRTPGHNHNAIELHAATVAWDDDTLTVHDASQMIAPSAGALAKLFGLKREQVRVLSPYVGGGFGAKGLWDHQIVAVAAARIAGRPVRLVLSRDGVYRIIGGRTPTEQRVAVGADAEGNLTALVHTGHSVMPTYAAAPEQYSLTARALYRAKSYEFVQHHLDLDIVPNTFMRAPGEAVGTFAVESAIDELAHEMGIDPIELRLRNEPDRHPISGTPFSQRGLVQAWREGAARFDWERRQAAPGTVRDGEWRIGLGCASGSFPYARMPGASVSIRLTREGRATVSCSAQDMGMATSTVQIQHAADRLGLPMEAITFEMGDSALPSAPMAGGSSQTVSIAAAIAAASEKLAGELLRLAGNSSPLSGLRVGEVRFVEGTVTSIEDPSRSETIRSILQRASRENVEVTASGSPPLEMLKFAMHSFSANFCEVRVSEVTGEVRVNRLLGSFDCGAILNPKTAESQFKGGMIMGIGLALTEETLFDERSGRIMNATLADYHVPAHLDVPELDVMWTGIPDPRSPLGARGIGEIGITGVAAAIANAVFNATGKRVRDLPITLDKLL